MRMVSAYSMFDNGGKKIVPTLIDRIQDRYGRTVYRHDRANAAAARPSHGRTRKSRPWSTSVSGHRSDDRLPDHLDDGRCGLARHRRRRIPTVRQAGRRQDRHHQRRKRRLVRRLLADIAVGLYLGSTSHATSAAAAPVGRSRRRLFASS